MNKIISLAEEKVCALGLNHKVDRLNREKHLKTKGKLKPDFTRRYQSVDPAAPVSRRKNKNRKEQEKSQFAAAN